MTNIIEKTDIELKTDVLSELKYEPSIKVTDIGVLVQDGTVTLNGYATSYMEKGEAVCATKRVAGVKAIADDIEVNLPGSLHRTDRDIAAAAANQLNNSMIIPTGAIDVIVREAWITLSGEVEWWYQMNCAEQVVQYLPGVKGVSNLMSIKTKLTATRVETDIAAAFKRNAVVDADKIKVEILENKVVLRGEVRHHTEREEAERVAWAAPGVSSVENHLTVRWLSFGE